MHFQCANVNSKEKKEKKGFPVVKSRWSSWTWFFSGTLSPAYPAPELYLAPQFDEFGAPLPPEDLEYDYNDDIFDEVDDIPAEPLSGGLVPTNFRGMYITSRNSYENIVVWFTHAVF